MPILHYCFLYLLEWGSMWDVINQNITDKLNKKMNENTG
jgi:hypothetical protein